MPVNISVGIDDREVRDLLASRIARSRDLTRPLSEFGLWVVRDAGRRLRARTDAGDSTGRLRSSISFRARPQEVSIGSNLPYAAVQQLGHPEIRPKPPLKRLAIPQLPHLRRRNVWPRDLPRGSLRVDTEEGLGLVLRGEDGRVWYRLVRKVTIPARPYLVFSRAAWDFLRKRLARYLGLTDR